jgi:hypothetical protein
VVRGHFVGAVVAFGVATSSFAQGAGPQGGEAEQIRARQQIFMMEGVLERAVQVGIDTLRRELSVVMPDDMLLVAGDGPQARGFRLQGYGVFFDVEVPQVRPSLAWSLRTMNETAAIFTREVAEMRDQIRQAVPDARQRAELDRQLVRLQQQVGPMPHAGAIDVADARAPAGTQSIERAVIGGRPAMPAPVQVPRDPGEAYTQAVAAALRDAMLENSGSLVIAPEEWLTIAARDNAQRSRFLASDPSEVMTLVLRVKGSDIAAFQARSLTLDEVRLRVEVRAF